MGLWKKAKPAVEAAEHLHFGETILHAVFDWRSLVAGLAGSVLTVFTSAYEGRSVTDVLLAAAAGLAAFTALAAGGLVLWRTVRNRDASQSRHVGSAKTDLVEIEFKWKPGGANDPFEISAIVTAKQNLKDFALIGHFAITVHYLSGAKWLWEPSIRLLRLDDFFKGEVKTVPVIRCPRSGSALTVFNERTWGLKSDGVLILLRVTAVSDSGEQHIQKAYNARQFGAQNDLQPIHLDDLSDIEGAQNPVVTRIASEPLDRPPQRVEFENVHPTSSAIKIETGSGPLF